MSSAKHDSLGYWKRMVFLLGLFKIPMLFFVRPIVLKVGEKETVVKIKLRRRTKNHLNSMYFGALAVGADLAAGLHTYYFAEKVGLKPKFAFKAIVAEFHKRAETDVRFISFEHELLKQALLQAKETGERVNQVVKVDALNTKDELVASFKMTVSVKGV